MPCCVAGHTVTTGGYRLYAVAHQPCRPTAWCRCIARSWHPARVTSYHQGLALAQLMRDSKQFPACWHTHRCLLPVLPYINMCRLSDTLQAASTSNRICQSGLA